MRDPKLVLFLCFCFIPIVAFSQDETGPAQGWYIRVDGGYSSALDPDVTIPAGSLPGDLGSSGIFGGGIGTTYVPGLRADLTFTYRSGHEQVTGFPDMPEGRADFRSLVTLLSLYLDIYSRPRVSPYGGFGLGFARNQLGDITITNPDGSQLGTIAGKNKTSFAWHVSFGAGIQVTNRLLLDLGYRYLKGGDYDSEGLLIFPDGSRVPAKNEGTFRANEVIVSLQYIF